MSSLSAINNVPVRICGSSSSSIDYSDAIQDPATFFNQIAPWFIALNQDEAEWEKPFGSQEGLLSIRVNPSDRAWSTMQVAESKSSIAYITQAIITLSSSTALGRSKWGRSIEIDHLEIQWRALNSSLRQWAELPVGWAGEGSIPPQISSVEYARKLLGQIQKARCPLPQPFIAADGEFGFRWRKGEAFASIAFPGDGTIVIYVQVGDGAPLMLDEPIDVGQNLDDIFRSLFYFA